MRLEITCPLAIVLGYTLITRADGGEVRADNAWGPESAELSDLRAGLEAHMSVDTSAASVTSTLNQLEAPDWSPRPTAAVERFITYFTQDPKGREQLSNWVRKLDGIRQTLNAVFGHYGLPKDLCAIVMAESGVDPKARSPKGALGLWQLMPDVGNAYALKQTFWVDERMDIVLSSHAAVKYLNDLKQRLGAWELVLAAYNMGYGALLRSARNYNSNDFYFLSTLPGALPFETTQYVPKIAALAYVLKNRSAWGLPLETATVQPRQPTQIFVKGGASLDAIAKSSGTPIEAWLLANPHLRRKRLQTDVEDVLLNLPPTDSHAKVEIQKRIAHWARAYRRPPIRPIFFGERLSDMADRLGVREAALRTLNDLGPSEQPPFGVQLVVPSDTREPPHKRHEMIDVAAPKVTTPPENSVLVFYKVIAGDTYAKIATFFNLSLTQIAEWNAIDTRAHPLVGSVLQLYISETFDLSQTKIWRASQVRLLEPGSNEHLQALSTQNLSVPK